MNEPEIRRQLRQAEAEQRSALPRWRAALHRIIEDRALCSDDKAVLLGAPDRRRLLKVGGAFVGGAAVIAACSSAKKASPETRPSTTALRAGRPVRARDLTLARTAVSIENLVVEVYGKVLGLDIEYDVVVADLAKLFKRHHEDHVEQLNAVLTAAGEKPYTLSNRYLLDKVVTPMLPTLTDQRAVASFARALEGNAASTYAFAAGQLSTADLRADLMSIGGVESRHYTAWSLVLDPADLSGAVPSAFLSTEVATGNPAIPGRIPDEAILD